MTYTFKIKITFLERMTILGMVSLIRNLLLQSAMIASIAIEEQQAEEEVEQ